MTAGPEIRSLGDRAWLLEVAADVTAAVAAGLAAHFPQALVVPGIGALTVEFPVGLPRPSALEVLEVAANGAARPVDQADAGRAAVHQIPVHYAGPDLHAAAAAAGVGPGELIRAHSTATWTVAAVGFAPGFAYLKCDDPFFDRVPRRAGPRSAVPAGAVALAAGMSAVYPSSSPGGWQLVGATDTEMFDPTSARPAKLAFGDQVSFIPSDTPPIPGAGTGPGSAPSEPATRSLRVTELVGLAIPADLGRGHLVTSGVPRGGPWDPIAHRTGQLLLVNAPDAAAIELVGEMVLELDDGVLAVCACGDAQTWIDDTEMPAWSVVELAAGQSWRIRSGRGVASIAVSGGFAGPAVMGSRATCTLGMIGPPPLQAGQVIGVGEPGADYWDLVAAIGSLVGSHARPPRPGGPVPFRPGPHVPLGDLRVRVLGSSRVGVRLSVLGPHSLPGQATLPSVGVLPGAIQVLPSGELVVLGPDAGTMGGYPIGGVVPDGWLWRLAGVAPGEELQLLAVGPSQGLPPGARLPRVVRHFF